MTTRERIMDILKERMEEGEPIVLQQELVEDDSIDTGLRNIQEQVGNLRQKDKLVQGWVKNGKRAYAHSDADVPELEGRSQEEARLRERIIEAHQRAEDILGGYRHPSLEETAYIGGFDSKDEEFRKAFFELKQNQNWTEPSEKIIEDWKEEIPELIGYATIILKLEDLEPKEVPGEEIYSSEKYAEKNKELIEEIEIKERKVGYDLRLPMKLVRFTDQRIINIQPTGDELEDRKYIVR
jgi:acyl-CoA synthetase (AMP-forming)/AMP-acid ligase II